MTKMIRPVRAGRDDDSGMMGGRLPIRSAMTKGQASDDERLPVGAGNDAWSGPAMTREMPDQVGHDDGRQ